MEDGEPVSGKRTLPQLVTKAKQYNEIAGIAEIARRSFGNNAFDGVLTMIGVMIGSLSSGVSDPHIVITTGMSTSVAIMISGAWGAFLTESAERKKELKELGQSMLTDLEGTRIGRASNFAAIAVSAVDGLSPFAGAIVVLLPFFFSKLFHDIRFVYYTSLGTSLIALFALGMWFGKVGKENLIVGGVKTLLAGLASILIGSLLSNF